MIKTAVSIAPASANTAKKANFNIKTAAGAASLIVSALAAVIIAAALPDSPKHQAAAHPYFIWLIIAVTLIYFTSELVKHKAKTNELFYRAPFIAGVILFFNIMNILSVKTAVLPVLYFPSLDRVIGTFFEDRELIIKCVGYSTGILLSGVFGGLLVGFVMGVGVGFSPKISYWINPLVRILGPIPPTAWIPIFLLIFPTARTASAFMIGLAVWFPTVVLTSSGISNVKNSFFEVGATLGANSFQRIVRIGIPAAMPSIFLGLFNGICSSFVTLMTAEMIGAKYGMGWYVNWQKEMMCYANVYAGLTVIAIMFYLVITVLFKVRDKVLIWQKGVIKW